jgi:hypothetical protein
LISYLWVGVIWGDGVSVINIDLNKVEYELGISYKEALSMAIRTNNELHDIVHAMQERIMCLEREVRCTHLFKNYDDYMMCVHCEQKKGF